MVRATLEKGLILTTDASCTIDGISWPGIPTLVWPDGIDIPAADWFRDLIIRNGKEATTVDEYANILRPFLRFCRKQKRTWDSIDDEFLILWRERLVRKEGVSIGRTNTVLKIIFNFYVWAEERGHIRYRVGTYTDGDLPATMAGFPFPITAKKTFSKSSRGGTFSVWTTPLTLSVPETGSKRHTPSEIEIREIHSVVADKENGERNSLFMSYAEETGGRRSEILQIGKSHMPTVDQLADLIKNDHAWTIKLKRKGNKLKSLHLPVELIFRTLDFIENERREVVLACRGEFVGYSEPDHIFLSSVTGQVLHPDSVTSIGRDAFMQAGVEDSNIHRLRARFAVRTVETLVDALFAGANIGSHSNWTETILTKTAEMMGHAHTNSLRPYLNDVLNRRIQVADATKEANLESRIRQLELRADASARRLTGNKELHQIARDLSAGNSVRAAAALRRLADEIDDGAALTS